MKIKLCSVLVNDQEKALQFYTTVLGFIKKTDIPMGEYRWLTVESPQEKDGIELLLEPIAFTPAEIFQKALFDALIPFTAFYVDDIQSEYERLEKLGVKFSTRPVKTDMVTIAVFEDNCGNLIQIYQS